MNNRLVYFFIIFLTSCGENKPDGKTSGRFDTGLTNCKISISKIDPPAVVARKAFQISTVCKINNEETLVKHITN